MLTCKQVQKLIAASPHLLIEGDPCLGKSLAASKKKLAGDVENSFNQLKTMMRCNQRSSS
jgi:EARLY FLOWERING 3 protein